jgi:hypothetical protein
MTDEEKSKEEAESEEKAGEKDELLSSDDVPPANFYSILATFQLPAMQFLGELKDPSSSEEVEIHPALAKYYIDCISVLDEKTRGNLADDEQKALDNILTQLRMLYVKNTPGDQ